MLRTEILEKENVKDIQGKWRIYKLVVLLHAFKIKHGIKELSIQRSGPLLDQYLFRVEYETL